MRNTISMEGNKVKKAIWVIMLMMLCVILTACGDEQQAPGDNGSQQIVHQEATPTPVPTQAPTPTPFPRVAPENYVMIWKSNPNRGINYMVPTHWEKGEEGERYVTYYEPVPAGETGFRVSFTNKKMSREMDSGRMREQLRDFLDNMKEIYDEFYTDGTISRDYTLVKFKGFHSTYTYVDDYGVKIKGFVIMATYNKRIYCMNFSGPESRFEEMTPIGSKMMENMSRS
ncbi:MAG: hypothetical protein IIX93_09550 [Clostridia bacterium]|nr:hypothetical protein [Clostridia bacterium]